MSGRPAAGAGSLDVNEVDFNDEQSHEAFAILADMAPLMADVGEDAPETPERPPGWWARLTARLFGSSANA